MTDHNMFLAQDVLDDFINDFMVLPFTPLLENVVQGKPEAVERHDLMFAFSH